MYCIIFLDTIPLAIFNTYMNGYLKSRKEMYDSRECDRIHDGAWESAASVGWLLTLMYIIFCFVSLWAWGVYQCTEGIPNRRAARAQ